MKFGEKYELLESLTTGGVETFVANDKVRGERVLVHILECEGQKPNQPTVQWVLEAFRRIAPEPAALVLETGRYSGTLYAYLVTKMPDEAALTNWVRAYQGQGRATQDIPKPGGKPSPESEAPTANLTSPDPSRAPGSITQLFRELDPDSKPAASSVSTKPTELPPQPLANAKPAPERSAIQPAPDWQANTPRFTPAKDEPTTSGSDSSFSAAFGPRNFPSAINSPNVKEGPRPGEFTSFFQGPFRPDAPSEIPALSPQQKEPSRKTVGDFTAMFNPPRAEEQSAAPGSAGNESPGAGFNEWFSTPNVASRTSGPAPAPPSGMQRSIVDDLSAFPAPSKEPFVPPRPVPYVAPAPVVSVPTPPIFPVLPIPSPAIEKQAAPSNSSSASNGATYAFNRPASEPAPVQPMPASGPSPYTQVISVRPSAAPAVAPKQASPAIPAGAVPILPAIAAPPMPAMPKIAVPPAPKPPKATVPEPPVSYWPLILTLTVLFFIAVLLVLYFALKR